MDYPKINQIETPITTLILIMICTWYAAIDLADFVCLFVFYVLDSKYHQEQFAFK